MLRSYLIATISLLMSPLTIFAHDKLNVRMWQKMEEIFETVAPSDGSPGHRKILVRSGNGAGYARRRFEDDMKIGK
jgi:hypothetical protein